MGEANRRKQAPSIGRIVHYRVPEEKRAPDSPLVAAAIITGIVSYGSELEPALVDLTVLPNRAAPFAVNSVAEVPVDKPLEDCWHWPMTVHDRDRIARATPVWDGDDAELGLSKGGIILPPGGN